MLGGLPWLPSCLTTKLEYSIAGITEAKPVVVTVKYNLLFVRGSANLVTSLASLPPALNSKLTNKAVAIFQNSRQLFCVLK